MINRMNGRNWKENTMMKVFGRFAEIIIRESVREAIEESPLSLGFAWRPGESIV